MRAQNKEVKDTGQRLLSPLKNIHTLCVTHYDDRLGDLGLQQQSLSTWGFSSLDH